LTIPLSETPTVGLGQFIKEVRFQVPSHQRDYSWKEEYVKQFVDDIKGAMDEGEQIYFCGLMVFTKTEAPAFQVLDSQQRLATTLMIFSAVRNWLKGYTAFQRAQMQIEGWYLGDSDLGELEIEPKLALNAANNDLFRRYVIDSVPIADKQIGAIADSFDTTEKARDYLLKMVNYITNTVQVVRLVVRGEEAAYTIFETLNDRGLDLAPLDLVKNFLFSRAEKTKGAGLRDLEDRWTEMMTILNEVKADSFLRAFWASKHGSIEGRKIFAAFKREYSDPPIAYNVSLDMRAAAERYVALNDANDPVWSAYSDKTRQSVTALSIIGATQLQPVTLAALEKFGPRELERLLWLLEVIAVRYQLVERGRPGRMESLGARTAKAISDGKTNTASQVFAELKELYIPDEDFRAGFETKVEREGKKAAYLLKGLEHQTLVREHDGHSRELIPGAVTVEHILPKAPGDPWKQEIESDQSFYAEFLNRLGNLCLLADANRALGNKSFEEKKKVFATSRIRITNSIAKFDAWDRAAVEKRQRHFAQLAVAEWRFQ
jgi:hypothetical protein